MEKNKIPASEQWRDGGKLILDAVQGITGIVESMHYRIADTIPIPGIQYLAGRKGLPSLIYRLIYGITGRINHALNGSLSSLQKIIEKEQSSPGREASISALNGVLGDYLAKQNNSLAIQMQFREKGIPVWPNIEESKASDVKQKYLILIHGSCMNDLQWNMQEHNHGEILANEFAYKTMYLHYNTGLHISENGKQLSDLLEAIFQKHQNAEIHILAHSMGGLVSRSACYYAEKEQKHWLSLLKKMIFLGTPHHGAPLEKLGNLVDRILASNPYSEPLSKLGQIRSAGITDMRYGNITDSDWKNQHRFFSPGDKRMPVPLPSGVKSYAIAAIIKETPGLTAHEIVGDGMVTLSSALGEHSNIDYLLHFPENRTFIAYNTGHLELLNNPQVYKKIKEFLADQIFPE